MHDGHGADRGTFRQLHHAGETWATTRSSPELSKARARLLPYRIGKHGQLQEWSKDFEESRRASATCPTCTRSIPVAVTPRRTRIWRRQRRFARTPPEGRRRLHRLEPRLGHRLLGTPGGRRPRARVPGDADVAQYGPKSFRHASCPGTRGSFKLTATSEVRQRSPRCWCRVMTARSISCPRYRVRGPKVSDRRSP